MAVLLALAIGSLFASGPAFAGPKSADTGSVLRWGADAEGGAPYISGDPTEPEKNVGFEVDLAQALSRELRRRIVFTQYDYKSLLVGLERGDIDIAMNGIEVTPDRERRVLFSRAYYVYRQQLVVRAQERRFTSLAGCKAIGCVVGTLEETAAERLLDRQGLTKKIYDGQVEPYRDLELGRVDAVLLDAPIAEYYARPNANLALRGAPFEKGYYAIALRKSDAALKAEFDAALLRLGEKGELRRIYGKWRIWNDEQRQLFSGNAAEAPKNAQPNWSFFAYLPLLLAGAKVTLFITLASMLLAIVLAVPIALMRSSGLRPWNWLALAYVEFFRGIPVLLLLYFLYYGLPGIAEYYRLPFELKLSPLQVAVLGFGLNYAAFEAEIYRAAIGSISVTQWEAAASLGMSRALTYRRIVLPQAIRTILPPLTNDLVALFKDTSIVSIIAVVELSKQYQILSKSSMKYLELGLVTAALYLIMSVPLGFLSRWLERRWGKHV